MPKRSFQTLKMTFVSNLLVAENFQKRRMWSAILLGRVDFDFVKVCRNIGVIKLLGGGALERAELAWWRRYRLREWWVYSVDPDPSRQSVESAEYFVYYMYNGTNIPNQNCWVGGSRGSVIMIITMRLLLNAL